MRGAGVFAIDRLGRLSLPLLLLVPLHLGCLPNYRFHQHTCSVEVRPLDGMGNFLGPTQRITTAQSGIVIAAGWSCANPPSEAETVARFESNLVGLLPGHCLRLDPETAAVRQLLCPARVQRWCKVPGTSRCPADTIWPLPSDCSAPLALLPDCPTMTAPGMPRLCMGPMGGTVDLGDVPRGTTREVRLRAINCGGGRLVAPAPTAVEADMTAVPNFPLPRLGCSLTPEETAAQGAFLGPADRTECEIVVPFAAVGVDGLKRARFTYRAAGGDPVDFDLLARVVTP
jgi:hypothetical protein